MLNTPRAKINGGLTKRLTQLHEKGFVFDFSIIPGNMIYCSQSELVFDEAYACIVLISQFYDCLTGQFQYVHTVETDSGERGILMRPSIYFVAR